LNLLGTVRTLSNDLRDLVQKKRVTEICEGIATPLAATATGQITVRNYPCDGNHDAPDRNSGGCRAQVFQAMLTEAPWSGGEDFAFMLEERPVLIFWSQWRHRDVCTTDVLT